MTTSRSRGRSTSIFLRLWTRAPRTAIQSCAIEGPVEPGFPADPRTDLSATRLSTADVPQRTEVRAGRTAATRLWPCAGAAYRRRYRWLAGGCAGSRRAKYSTSPIEPARSRSAPTPASADPSMTKRHAAAPSERHEPARNGTRNGRGRSGSVYAQHQHADADDRERRTASRCWSDRRSRSRRRRARRQRHHHAGERSS